MKKTIQNIVKGLLHLIYPKLCVACSKALIAQEEVLCIECFSNLSFTNFHHIPHNETAQRFAGRIQFEHASSLAYYPQEGILQKLLHDFKYKNNKAAGVFLAKRFAQALKKTAWAKDIDVLIPVPLHSKKQALRGYNQSEILAKTMAEDLCCSVNNQSLIRVLNTESQTRKSRAERVQNMVGAFRLIENQSLKGKHVLLLDDVLTTGSTIEACVKTLQEIDNIKISIATIGIAMD